VKFGRFYKSFLCWAEAAAAAEAAAVAAAAAANKNYIE